MSTIEPGTSTADPGTSTPPFFVGVGAQKAGTTWLHDQLARHPEVALPPRKEVHYFDSVYPVRVGKSFGARWIRDVRGAIEARRAQVALEMLDVLSVIHRGDQAYRDYLLRWSDRRTVVAGEITPSYSILTEEGFRAMRELLDSPKIIFLMRDPVDRHWSMLRMADPAKAAARFAQRPRDTGATARGDYRATVQLLDKVFGDDVLYLFYENLAEAATLRSVARHLGVAEEWSWDLEQRSNVGAEIDRPELTAPLKRYFAPQYAFVRERFGDRVPASWLDLDATTR